MNAEQLARMTGCSTDEASRVLQELKDSGVFYSTRDGVIYCKRMVEDEQKREVSKELGMKGGNPHMDKWKVLPGFVYAVSRPSDGAIKLGASVNPRQRKNSGTGSMSHESCVLVRQWAVTQMGTAEGLVQALFSDRCVGGEWFNIKSQDLEVIEGKLRDANLFDANPNANGAANQKRTPSSSVSSSSSPSSNGILMNLTLEELKQPAALLVRYREWVGAGYGGTVDPMLSRLRFFAAAENATDPNPPKPITNPPGRFRDIVLGGKWHMINNGHEMLAEPKLKALDRAAGGFA